MSLNVNFGKSPVEAKAVEKAKNDKNKTKIVYVTKNPDAAVNASGVVAGTAGLVGGAVLGGTVGVCKLPGELLSTVASQEYGNLIKNAAGGLKDSPALMEIAEAISNLKSPQAVEEFAEVLNTMTTRLHTTFKNDKVAASVVDEVIDPIIKSISLGKNVGNYAMMGSSKIKSPAGQTILKLIGFNKKTSKVVGSFAGNVAEGLTQAVINIRNFTPEQKEAWGKICNQMINELEKNPKVKTTSGIIRGIKLMVEDSSSVTRPVKSVFGAIRDGAKNLNKNLGKVPIKTIGKWSAIGAAACSAISLAGWGIFKSALMKKETKNSELA